MARRVLAITLAGASLVAFGCGGDDDSPQSSTTGAGTTSGSGATSKVPPIPEFPDDAAARTERGSSGNRSSGSRNGSSGRSGRGRSRQPGFSAPGLTPGSAGESSPNSSNGPPPALTNAAAERLAKQICSNVTLEGVALNLRISLEKRDAEFVARAFSRRYPEGRRDAAYRGCIEGFRDPVTRP